MRVEGKLPPCLDAPENEQPQGPLLTGDILQPMIRSTVCLDAKFLGYQQSLKRVTLPSNVDQLKHFIRGDAAVKIPLRRSFYETLLKSPHWAEKISSIAIADDRQYSPVFEGIITSLSTQILGCHNIDSEIPMAKFIDDNMTTFLSLLTGCDIFHNVTATTLRGLRPDLFLANEGFAPIFVGEDKLRKDYQPGHYNHDPTLEHEAKTPWNYWNDFFSHAPYILAYSAIGDNFSIDTTIGVLDPRTCKFVPISNPLNILSNASDRVELFILCVKLFPIVMNLHGIIRNNPIPYNIEDQHRIMDVNVTVKKSLYSRNRITYFHKEWTFPLSCTNRAQAFYQKLQAIFNRLQNYPHFLHLSSISTFGIEENVVKATFEPYGSEVAIRTMKELIYYLLQICHAINLLHCEGIIHNDIRWDNILMHRVGDRFEIFLIDFDDAFLSQDRPSVCPPITHLSVEEHAPNINEIHGAEVDVFAVGKLLHQKLSEIHGRGSSELQDCFKDISQYAQDIMKNYKSLLCADVIAQLEILRDKHGLTDRN